LSAAFGEPAPTLSARSQEGADMASIPPSTRVVIGGIDTHKDLHVAAALDSAGMVLGSEAFSTTRAGYRALVRWLRSFGDVRRVGIEGTGSYGAGITRHLHQGGIDVLEVDRPDRSDRRRRGTNDTLDAENAARAALAGRRTSVPKTNHGKVEALRVLRLTRTTAIKSRRAALPAAAQPHRLRP
jgi:transposase